MARAATETQEAGLSGLEFGLAIPGTVGGAVWANAGAHESDVRPCLESARVLLADGTRGALAARRPRPGLPRQPVQARPTGSARPSVVHRGRRFRLDAGRRRTSIKARLDEIRRWRQAHQPLGMPSAGSVFRNPADGPSAGRADRRAAGSRASRIGGATVSEKHANFIVNDRKGTRRRRPAPGGARPARPSASATGVELVPEIVFVGDWSGWPWPETRRWEPIGPAGRSTGRVSSADRRPSTTCRSSRAPPSPTRWRDARPSTSSAGPDRPRRRLVVAAGGPSARRSPGSRLRRPGRARRRRARSTSAPPSTGWRRADRRRRSSFIALHGPFGEDGTVQALLEAAGLAYTGSGVLGSALGMDKALLKRIWRGLGLPVVDWLRGPRRALGGRPRRASWPSSRRSPRAAGDPRLMVKPARLGSSVGMTLAHTAAERAAGARARLPLRRPRDRRALPRRGAGPRGLGHRHRAAGSAVRAGRDRAGPRVLRLRREVHAGPVRDVDPRRGARRDPRAAMRKLARDAYRALGAEGFARVDFLVARRRDLPVRDQHDPGLHARSACSRRCRPRPASTSPPSACGSSTSRSSGTPPGCAAPDARRPAAMRAGVPARRRPTPRRPAPRRCAGRRPVAARVGRAAHAGPGRRARSACSLGRALAIYGVGVFARLRRSTTLAASTGADLHGPGRGRRPRSTGARGRTCSGSTDRARSRRRCATCPPSPSASVTVALPGALAVTHRGAQARPRLAGRRHALPRRRARADLRDARPTTRRRAGRRRRSSTTGASGGAALRIGQPPRPGRPRRGHAPRRPEPGRHRQRRHAAAQSRSPTPTASSLRAQPDGWTAVFGFYSPAAPHRHDPRPGPPAAQPARRPRGTVSRGSSSPRRRTAPTSPAQPVADAEAQMTDAPVTCSAPVAAVRR